MNINLDGKIECEYKVEKLNVIGKPDSAITGPPFRD
jgi:hypothetical protein